jgi:hypothetical protein
MTLLSSETPDGYRQVEIEDVGRGICEKLGNALADLVAIHPETPGRS